MSELLEITNTILTAWKAEQDEKKKDGLFKAYSLCLEQIKVFTEGVERDQRV